MGPRKIVRVIVSRTDQNTCGHSANDLWDVQVVSSHEGC